MQTSILPVSYGPLGTANLLTIRGVGPVDDSGRPSYFYDVSSVTDAVPPATTSITSGNIAMTKSQWDNWGKTPTDEEYQLSCIATNLGLTRA